MLFLFKRLRKYFPILALFIIELVLFVFNYKAGTYFVGWDSLFPEADFWLNIKRSLTGLWLEYRGLGLLDGMSFIANLAHHFFLFFLSLFFPKNLLRYIFFFLMHFLGGVGVYFLSQKLKIKSSKLTSFLAALFYLLNIGTVQMFYAPYELFAVFFAVLPWLIFLLLNFLERPLKKNLLWFFLINLLATPQAHVPSVFIVYLITVGVFLGFFFWQKQDELSLGLRLKNIGLVILTVFAANAFWGLPYFYSALKNTEIVVNSKINQMSNVEILLRNKAFGDFKSVVLLKGFNLAYFDYQDGKNDLLMRPWVEHLERPGVELIGWGVFLVVLLGLITVLKEKKKKLYPFVFLFVFSFLVLGNDIPILSFFSWFLQNFIPFFAEVFRFSFTKFIILYAFCFGILFGFGLESLFRFLKRWDKVLLFLFLMGCFVYYSLPLWHGDFLYSRLKVKIPQEYFQLIEFFKKQDKEARIAILPSPSFWGWTTNKWGFRGSGFLWYGIEQPVTDRAFDPWSKQNEQFYWELSYAFDNRDRDLFGLVLQKYDISWILFDQSIINPLSSKPIEYEKIASFLPEVEGVHLEKRFRNLYVYKVGQKLFQKDFVSVVGNLPVLDNDFDFSWRDQGYNDWDDYIEATDHQLPNTEYLFASLFTNRLQRDIEFVIQETDEGIILAGKPSRVSGKLVLSNIAESEALVPVRLWGKKIAGQSVLGLECFVPLVLVNEKAVTENVWETFSLGYVDNLFLQINDWPEKEIESFTDEQKVLEEAYFYTDRSNFIKIKNRNGEVVYELTVNIFEKIEDFDLREVDINEGDEVKVVLPKFVTFLNPGDPIAQGNFDRKPQNCRTLSDGVFSKKEMEDDGEKVLVYKAQNASSCERFLFENLPHNQGYLFKIVSRSVQSMPFKAGVENITRARAEIDTLLSNTKEFYNNYLIVPPTEEFDKGYSVFLDTVSFGREVNENHLKSIEVYPIPYRFLKKIRISSNVKTQNSKPQLKTQNGQSQNENFLIITSKVVEDFEVEKKAGWLYKVKLPRPFTPGVVEDFTPGVGSSTIVLSQAYHPGWTAFMLGTGDWKLEALDHVLINNWANGWKLDPKTLLLSNSKTLYILFWPQLLEFLGFGVMVGMAYFLIKSGCFSR